MGQSNPKAPFLRKLRELQRLSRRALAERAGVSAETIQSLENGNPGRWRTIEALAGALDVPEQDLTGNPNVAPEVWDAYLDELALDKTTLGPGDHLFDADPLASMTDAELAAYVRKNPDAHRWVAFLMSHREKMRTAIELEQAKGGEEREKIEAERHRDAG